MGRASLQFPFSLIRGGLITVVYTMTPYRLDGPRCGEIFRTDLDRARGPPSLQYNGYWVSFPGVKWPGRGVDHPSPSTAKVFYG